MMLGAALLTSLRCAAQPAEAPAGPPVDLQTEVLKATMGTWWGGIFVVQHGKVVLKYTNGLANDDLVPFDEHTLFDLGDLSMQMTCAAALRLEQENKFSIDDPLSKFFPEATGASGKITVRQLMNHSSGISDKVGLPPALDFTQRDGFVAAVLATPLAAEPGGAFVYSRRGSAVLAAVIEKASGQTFEAYLREHVFAPAGLHETGFLDGEELEKSHAAIRLSADRAPLFAPQHWNWGTRGNTGILTTLSDMIVWDRALGSDVLLTPGAREKMTQLRRENYALGWYVNSTLRNTRRVWHGGASPGFVAIFFRFVDDDTDLFVIGNDSEEPDKLLFHLCDLVFPPMPETLSGEILLGAQAFNAAPQDVSGPLVYQAARVADGDIELKIFRAEGQAAVARLKLSEGLARHAQASIKDAIVQSSGKCPEGTIANLNPGKLGVGVGNKVTFSKEARLEVRAWLRGSKPDGSDFREDRPVLAVIDPGAQAWVLTLRMDEAGGRQLYDALEKGLKGPLPGAAVDRGEP
jgi:D-alanyl-D-alanine carboxypeptidase